MIDRIIEFFSMGGHGLYVWLSYGAAVILISFLVVSLRRKKRRLLRDLADQQLRNRG
tara:strand:- start:2022 stop:2192 length:171 start_codon:yes stop_codon:yes gene_type:complete